MPKCSCKEKDFTKAVIEINNPEQLILFRKVVIPTSMGDETAVPPAVGKYHNVLLVYEVNSHAYLYSSDGIPTLLTSDVSQELEQQIKAVADDLAIETTARQGADTALGGRIDSTENRLTVVEGVASTAVQPAVVNKTVVTGLSVNSGINTTIQLDSSKQNILSGNTSTSSIVLPVASHDVSGVMNQATYDAVTNNTANINAITNGAVAVSGLAANPSQADISTAWRQETGLSTLINRASVYDVTNDKVWTYYVNDTTWHAASNTTQVTINTFTNSSEGTIRGSTNTGQVFAENDGTGSVNGWDALSNAVASKQDALTIGTGLSMSGATLSVDTSVIAQRSDIPTVNNATLTIQKNGSNIQTFTANSSSNKTANITVPTKVSELENDSGYTTNVGTITAVQANGTSIATSGTANIPAATTSAYGVTQLSSSTSSTSTSVAATPSAVKAAYDLASTRSRIVVQGTDPGEGVDLSPNYFIAVYNA